MGHAARIMIALAGLALAAAVAAKADAAPTPTAVEATRVLEEVRKPGASGTVVNVWATWCSPCREEFPDLLHVARELAPKGVRLVLVSVDFPGMEPEATEFLTSQGVDFPTFMRAGNDEAFVDGLEPKWSGAIPVTLVYDGGGKLVRLWEGKASYPVIKKRVLEALAPKKETP
ncbi:MAG TPA: TlpA disulfide reductase family protein [Candidatus Polarisedimenticolaceae bacterium]|nr:TlpA disulfide reductase family protein [Candidatus Polarisedimenticolaceae bacterium]